MQAERTRRLLFTVAVHGDSGTARSEAGRAARARWSAGDRFCRAGRQRT